VANAGDLDAAMTYEPYLSTVRDKPEAGKIIATTLDYPMVMSHLRLHAKFPQGQPKAAKALADSYFEGRRHDQARPEEVLRDHGADVKQSGEASRSRRPICAGRTRRRTRISLPASTRSSRKRRPIC